MEKHDKNPGSLLTLTVDLLQHADLTEVAYKTKIPYLWLLRVREGRVSDPSVNRIQTVFEHLNGDKLC